MTAVDLDALDKLRGALAEHRLTTPRQCLCGWRQGADAPWSDFAWSEHAADALLLVVDRIANERAAAMLRAAADWIWDDVPALASASAELHARADHLDPP